MQKEIKKDKTVSIFMENIDTTGDGSVDTYIYSMKRTCAFMMFILSAILGILSIALPVITALINFSASGSFELVLDWRVTLVGLGVPAIIGVILIFITSWQDIQSVVRDVADTVRGSKEIVVKDRHRDERERDF